MKGGNAMEPEKIQRLDLLEEKQKTRGLLPGEKEELRLLNMERLAERLAQTEDGT